MTDYDKIKQNRDKIAAGLDWLHTKAYDTVEGVLDEVFVRLDEALDAAYEQVVQQAEAPVEKENLTNDTQVSLMVSDLVDHAETTGDVVSARAWKMLNTTGVDPSYVKHYWQHIPADFKNKRLVDFYA